MVANVKKNENGWKIRKWKLLKRFENKNDWKGKKIKMVEKITIIYKRFTIILLFAHS